MTSETQRPCTLCTRGSIGVGDTSDGKAAERSGGMALAIFPKSNTDDLLIVTVREPLIA